MSSGKPYDVLLRLLIIGDSGVGKTCILCRYVDDQFYPNYMATIGIDFKVKNLVVDGKRVRVQIWDTAGQERFETITKQYYRHAQGVLLVYDITNSASYGHLPKWLSFVGSYGKSKVETTLLANKTDLNEWRQVSRQQGHQFAHSRGFPFFEASAYQDSGQLNQVFEELISRIVQSQWEELSVQRLDSDLSSESEEEQVDLSATTTSQQDQRKCLC